MHKTLMALGTCLAMGPVMAATYCDSRGNSISEWMAGVSVNGVDQASGNDGGYLDATGKPPFQLTGKGDRLELRHGFRSYQYTENWGAWIDFNQNGTFEASETVLTARGNTVVSAPITIPSGVTGTTRMRVQVRWSAAAQPCGNIGYGETEDYTVKLPDAPAPSTFPYTLTLEPGFWVSRSGDLGDDLTLVVEMDGKRVFGGNAAGRLRDRYWRNAAGSHYRIWLEASNGNGYKTVSNTVSYQPGVTDRVVLTRDASQGSIRPSTAFQGNWVIARQGGEVVRQPAQAGVPLQFAFTYGERYQVWAESNVNGKDEAISVPLAFREGFPPPYIDLEVEADFLLRHNGPSGKPLSWVIRENGVEVLRQPTGGASELRYPFQKGSQYKVWIEQAVGGESVQVSDAEYFSPGLTDLFQLTIGANNKVTRSGSLNDPLTWVIEEDGNIVLERNAANELTLAYSPYSPTRIWLTRFVKGYYQRVSNVVRFDGTRALVEGYLPLYQLSVDGNQNLTRTQGTHTMLTWVIEEDGQIVLERSAESEESYHYFAYTPGKRYRTWLKAFIDGRYQRVSPVVSY
ncbi:GEVED domain-containing protein [Metapseudomonas otitidis]|uniref:GEVED domain-containing protein n=1 Tax=Metapseudomonas otitidis TaxID=319939 RepID=UPI002449746C|nr:GEVED domain-containing protein [Pseudomonas otitidis]MDH0335715.1 GEVED domain-containing protein [Pseudomonas otitidis]